MVEAELLFTVGHGQREGMDLQPAGSLCTGLLTQSGWRSFLLPLVPVDCFSHIGRGCLGPLFWALISMCKEICGMMSCSGHVSISIWSPPKPSLRQNCASASAGWLTETGRKQMFSLSRSHFNAGFYGMYPSMALGTGLWHGTLKRISWLPSHSGFWTALGGLIPPSAPAPPFFAVRGQHIAADFSQPIWQRQTSVRALVRVLQKAISPSIREHFLRCKVWKTCTTIPLVLWFL